MSSHFYTFLPDGVMVRSGDAFLSRYIYAPLCGSDGESVKSAVTPYLSGDIKVDKGQYLTRPVSREDLRQPVRNFFARVDKKDIVSFHDNVAAGEEPYVELGQLWHRAVRSFSRVGIRMEALNFVPVSGEKIELMRVTVRNTGDAAVTVTPTAVIPVFGRSLANKHDHEHVTALLHRITQTGDGVCVEPVMQFDEEGHKPCRSVYYVFGAASGGGRPKGSFPTSVSFFGEAGLASRPEAVVSDRAPRCLPRAELDGNEAVGALRFEDVTLAPSEEEEYIIAVGIAGTRDEAGEAFARFCSPDAFVQALEENKKFWDRKTSAVVFDGADKTFASWMRWVALQPVLRRIFGCSFLPDHDYGKGGKGWRDIWQDLLSLILIEPSSVRDRLLNNFAGIRIDGSNATIIGQRPGDFLADRNAITRVWMDHGVWPLTTTLLYVDQTGDFDLLFEKAAYFLDPQRSRTFERDRSWSLSEGHELKDRKGDVYRGTVLEHLLLPHLVQFFNVGEHNITRLESADWNDGLDMAFPRGESVAFMSFYAGNLLRIADLAERLASRRGVKSVRLAREMLLLLDTLSGAVDYDSVAGKKSHLFDEYFPAVQPVVSGETVDVAAADLVKDLRRKGEWMFAHIREQEKITIEEGGERLTWFNGYYDNEGERVEGRKDDHVRMTLTGQVFPLMSGLATREETAEVIKAVEHFLKDKKIGGYRLNTDFGVPHYLALGRAFGFAFGTKENGSVFSHMVVMYAWALYAQGFAREGHEALRSLYDMSVDVRARIYPGVPEYFDAAGRGMYHFLTGSASWYVLTMLTRVYGVRGQAGDLVLSPQLVAEQFDRDGRAAVRCQFAGKSVEVVYDNPGRLDVGAYVVRKIEAGGKAVHYDVLDKAVVRIPRVAVNAWPASVDVKVFLDSPAITA